MNDPNFGIGCDLQHPLNVGRCMCHWTQAPLGPFNCQKKKAFLFPLGVKFSSSAALLQKNQSGPKMSVNLHC